MGRGRDDLAPLADEADALGIEQDGRIGQWVPVEDDEVGDGAAIDAAHAGQAQGVGRAGRRGDDALTWREEPRADPATRPPSPSPRASAAPDVAATIPSIGVRPPSTILTSSRAFWPSG